MVDAENLQIEFCIMLRGDGEFRFFRDSAAEEVFRPFVRVVEVVAESEALHAGSMAHQSESERGGRVDEVDHPCFRCEFLNVACDPQDFGKFAECAEDAAGADGVAGTHRDAVFAGYADIRSPVVRVAERETGDDEIRIFHHIAAVDGAGQLKRCAGVCFRAPGKVHHGVQYRRIGVDKRQSSGAQNRALRHVVNDCASEKDTSGADHDDFWSFVH